MFTDDYYQLLSEAYLKGLMSRRLYKEHLKDDKGFAEYTRLENEEYIKILDKDL